MLALLAPGQGSQTPGFLAPWLEDAKAAELIGNWSEVIGIDLKRLGTVADADEIRDTANAQPLLVAGGLIGAGQLLGENHSSISYTAGHSVGEITASVFAGVLDAESAMKLVAARGAQMAIAAKDSNTGMSAVLGGERDVVVAAINAAGLTAANENGAGQIVAAGSLTALGGRWLNWCGAIIWRDIRRKPFEHQLHRRTFGWRNHCNRFCWCSRW